MMSIALLAAAEASLNQLLQLDATALPRLAALQGRVLAVECSNHPAIRLYLLPDGNGIRLANQWEAPADCTLRAPLNRLLQLVTHDNKTAILHAADVDLSGNSGDLLALAAILQSLELDWESCLAEWLGPLAAVAIARPLQNGSQWTRNSLARLPLNLNDWLTEEARALMGRNEAEARFAELDALKLALDRLEARCAQLDRRLPEPTRS